MKLPTLFLFACSAVAGAADPQLIVELPGRHLALTRSQLLARADVEHVQIEADAAYGKRMDYSAIRLAALLKPAKIARDASVEFVASDGFTSSIRYEHLRNTGGGKAVAYLAIEEPEKPWPALEGGKSAGPYYLVWKDPAASGIAKEQWPYAVARIVVRDSLEHLYPAIQPARDASAAVKQGYQVYIKNCLSCHPINGAGPSRSASDLNLPKNPMDTLSASEARRIIRAPGGSRTESSMVMPPFPPDALSEIELDHLIAFLEHMARHKVATTRE